ncbi:glucosyl transferase [Intrasporangium oryzae NRRL B-24470]|uniref:Glucosyl transferase n=1 Tax=Intrasporangium oryzae NRRL B-24470 TaxID=1386089 RepID=W9GE76_9MICO|nr:glycosyltransferase family 2 protein [Intrasporangium oryzae]EWT03128.1 glucosyl transferase [Intrasporangium oryzae NRRL B-24470]
MVPELSVVIPMYNEEEVLPLLVERLRPILDGLATSYEVVAVDDGSSDLTAALLQRYHREWPHLRVIRLRANAGHQAAISAGLASALGDYVVTLDADLQDPPEVIPLMLKAAKDDGVDVVYGVRNDRSTDTWFKRVSARAFYRLIGLMSQTSAHSDAGDFRLMSRATVDAVNSLPEHNRVLRFIVPALNFPSDTVEYKRDERAAGSSKYPLMKMIKLSLDSLTGFSTAPLRMATFAGLGGAVLATMLLIYTFVARAQGHTVAGWTSTVAIVSGVGAVQLVCVGILGEYIGRMYAHMQGRPTYFIAYDSLTTVGREHNPTSTPLPATPASGPLAGAPVPDAAPVATPAPVPAPVPAAASVPATTSGPAVTEPAQRHT